MEPKLSLERARFWQKVGIIRKTEGFLLLTPSQKRMLILSLFVTDRHQRDERAGEQSQLSGLPYRPVYRLSSYHIYRSYCHGAIRNLEEGLPVIAESYPQFSFPASFFEAKYIPIDNEMEALKLIELQKYPCVVFINSLPQNKGIEYQSHSFLVLGHVNEEIVVWEKWGVGVFYRITGLQTQLIRHNNTLMYWGVRPLRRPAC